MAGFFQRRPRAVTASAAKLTSRRNSYSTRMGDSWQNRALQYYDLIGELRYASQFYARQLARIRIFPSMLKEDGTTEPIESGPPVDILDQIQDPGGGRSRLQYDYGRLMFITGEGVLFGDRLGSEQERWRFLWKDEVEEENGVTYRKDRNKQRIEEGIGYRLWTPHPAHSDDADSPMRSVLDIAEELVILTASVRGTAVSRLTRGILLMATEISPAAADPGTDEDPELNIFVKDLTDHLMAQIEDPSSAASMVPFVSEVAGEFVENGLKWVQTHDPATDYMERDLRIEAVKRLALGLDLPPEVLLGMTDANHWTAKQVQHDMWRSHGVTKAEQFCDDLAEAYLRPALEEDGFSDWDKVVISFDDSDVVVSPDRSQDALEVFKVGGLSWEALRAKTGFTEKDAPSDDELAKIAALLTRNQALISEEFDVAPAPAPTGPPASANGHVDAAEGPPQPTAGRPVSRQEARTASILGAAALAVRLCRAKAGARLRTQEAQKRAKDPDYCTECEEILNQKIPNSLLASALGMERLREVTDAHPIHLVSGGSDEFRGILSEWGIDNIQASAMCQQLEAYAAQTLFQERQPELPPGFAALVEQAKEVPRAVEHSAA